MSYADGKLNTRRIGFGSFGNIDLTRLHVTYVYVILFFLFLM